MCSDLFKLQSLIDEGSNLVNQNSKKAIFLFGKTGAGKSTLANLLLDKELRAIKHEGSFKIDTAGRTDIKISHGHDSETQIPSLGKFGDTVVFDCPGFEDADYVKRIANIYYIDKLCKMHGQKKFLFVTPFADLTNRSDGFINQTKQVVGMFKDVSQIKEFFSLFVTCVPSTIKKDDIVDIINNILLKNLNLSDDVREMLVHSKDSVCVFCTPEKEGRLDLKELLSVNNHDKYCTNRDIRLLVNVEKDQEESNRDLAKKMLNISSDNLNQVAHVIKKTIKNPFECVGNKNNIFIRNHHFIKEWTQGVAGYGGDKVDLFDLFAGQQTRDGHFSNLDLLNSLSKTLEGDINSYEDFFEKITGAIRQFGCYAKGKDVKFFQEEYGKVLQDYVRYSQEQFGYVEFFSNMLGSSLERPDKLKTIISECAKANELNLKEAVISMVLEQGQNAAYYEKALKYLSLYNELECKINTANAYIELGNIYLAKETKKAIDSYVGAIKAHPASPEAYKKLGEILCEKGCYKEAIKCYKVINHYLNVIDSFDKWIINQRSDLTTVLDILIEKGDYCKSISLYEDAKKAYMRGFSLTNDKMTLKKLSYKIANILENMTNTADNFNRMADEENFYNFNELDVDSIELSGDG